MKTYIYIILIVLLTLSCNDSFLERIPKDKLSNESFWKVEDDAIQYSTAIYRHLSNVGNHLIMSDAYTDNAVPVHIHAEQGDINYGSATSSNPHFKQVWQKNYQGIRRCNIFLENIGKVNMSQERMDILIGEVEFLRAYFHADLLKYFGGIPIITSILELNETIPTRNTSEEVYAFVLEECDKAAVKLPVNRSNSVEVGRANKGAALALKAHISYLMKDYATAQVASKAVMDLGTYQLYNSFNDLFLAEHENNSEVIFDRQFMANATEDGTGSEIDQYFAPIMMGGWEALSPTQDIVDQFECTDGKSIHESALYNPKMPYENRDPRLSATVLWHGRDFAGDIYTTDKTMGKGNATRTGYVMRKYIDEGNKGMIFEGQINYIYFRLAEILLIYAESENELNGPNASAYAAVNQIRQRPSVNLPPLSQGLSKEQLRDAIRHERRVEFVFEGKHLFDTRSWKTTEQSIEKPVYGVKHTGEVILIDKREFNPNKDYLWAIPLTEIDLSKGSLVQNPGY